MDKKRTVLLVEDIGIIYQGLQSDLSEGGWEVVRAREVQDAWHQINLLVNAGRVIDLFVVDLGLPPAAVEPLRSGLPLVRELRSLFETTPILAYTNLSVSTEQSDYSLILSQFLPLRVSLVYPRHLPDQVSFLELMERVLQGFVILSPTFANLLPYAVPSRPDPLTEDLWYTLKLLNEGFSTKEIVARIPTITGPSGLQRRLDRCKELLQKAGELESYENNNDDLKRWYREHYARYCRGGS